MAKIAVIQGHPDAAGGHLCHALAEAYVRGARDAGHEVEVMNVAAIDFPVLRDKDSFYHGAAPDSLKPAQDAIAAADHLVVVYPLWLGTMPALLKAFFEQALRPGFAVDMKPGAKSWTRRLTGKSARIVVTMGMPALVYRWYFGAHSLKSLERNILGFCGIGPIRESLFGMVEGANAAKRETWLAKMRRLGAAAR